MAYSVLMIAILVVSFVLMFALVKFTEGIITSADRATEEPTAGARRP